MVFVSMCESGVSAEAIEAAIHDACPVKDQFLFEFP